MNFAILIPAIFVGWCIGEMLGSRRQQRDADSERLAEIEEMLRDDDLF